MHGPGEAAFVSPDAGLKEVIIAMTKRPLGAACVVSANGMLAGFLTDGDLRRALTSHDDIRGLRAADAMTRAPITICPDATLGQAVELMERRPSQISVLPVVDAAGRALGILRLHDVFLGARK
jgi:arabinose-5-phosphate isomerase